MPLFILVSALLALLLEDWRFRLKAWAQSGDLIWTAVALGLPEP